MQTENCGTIFFQQSYEFRCLDDLVTTISCFKTKDLFVCGFESGNLRLFDLSALKITLEMTFEEKKVEQVEVSNSDE